MDSHAPIAIKSCLLGLKGCTSPDRFPVGHTDCLDSGVRRNDYDSALMTDVTWTYSWDVQDRLTEVKKDVAGTEVCDKRIEYEYCATCGGALSERIEYDNDSGGDVVSWLRYEYEGLNLLRIDERYDDDDPANGIDSGDPWRPLNVFIHAPGSIGQIVRAKWYNYGDCTTTPCDSGYYYYFYDALGNVAGVYDENTDEFIDYEMDAFGNDLPGGNSFLAMDQPGPKEHLTGKMYDTDTGLYYFHARWYDPEVGRFVSRDPAKQSSCAGNSRGNVDYAFVDGNPVHRLDPDGRLIFSNCTPAQIADFSKWEIELKNTYLKDSHPFCKAISVCKRIRATKEIVLEKIDPALGFGPHVSRNKNVCEDYCSCYRRELDKTTIQCNSWGINLWNPITGSIWLDPSEYFASKDEVLEALVHELGHKCYGFHSATTFLSTLFNAPKRYSIYFRTQCDPYWLQQKFSENKE